MSRLIKFTWFILLLAGSLVSCAAPAPTQPAPTPTSAPSIPGEQVVISVDNETFNATVTGSGEIGVILANTGGNDPLRWSPLVEALRGNEKIKLVTFAYRTDNQDTHMADTLAVFDYLKSQGIGKIICIGAHPGSFACYGLKDEPEMIGMVLMATEVPGIDKNFPKLFITADADPLALAGNTQRAYEQSAEPKIMKTYAAGVHGPALFSDPNVGSQVLTDVTEFINGIVNGQ